jgi:hypothetical protein
MSFVVLSGLRRALACAASLAVVLVTTGTAHATAVAALALPGPYPVACGDIAQDPSRVASGTQIADYWEGTRAHYAAELLAEPASTIGLAVATPADGTLFGSYAGKSVSYVALVCYPTTLSNARPDYALPGGASVPHMQRAGDAPLFADPSLRYPVILFSHGYGGSPLGGDYFAAVVTLASYGYVVAAPFHGDPRFSDLTPDNLGNVFYLVAHLSDFIAMQALRPLALSALLDRLLADPAWSAHLDAGKVGGFGASQGGESLLLMAGGGLTSSIGQSWSRVEMDPRLKAAVGYVPYFGQLVFPAFGRDAHGLDGVTLPYLAIGGTADVVAPLAQTAQGLTRLASPRALVTLDGVDHRFDTASAGDIYTWTITFLDATVRGDLAAYARLAAMTSVAGGGGDALAIPLDGAQSANFGGLWWNAPAGSESGWGINLAHQADTIYATWFTYDAAGKATWLALTASRTADATYTGTIVRARGPAFDALPFDPAAVTLTDVGTGTLAFDDASNGRFTYAVSGAPAQTKSITRQVFGPPASCWYGTQPDLAAASNYQDLWWNAPAGAESGWGINFTHQGDTIFATWFTYDRDGTPLWLSLTAPKTADRVYTGTVVRTSGPAFGAPFDPAAVTRTSVGRATLAFADGNHATFSYDVLGSAQGKAITREVFAGTGTACR